MANHKHDICTLEHCDAPHKARGLCNPHYMEARRNFEFEPKKWTKPMDERKRPKRNPQPGDPVDAYDEIDSNDFWEFVKKEMKL